MNTQFWIQIVVYAVSIGCIYGGIAARLKTLEKKVDKHNNLVERMYRVEAKVCRLEEKIHE
jgi:hypothetical protein